MILLVIIEAIIILTLAYLYYKEKNKPKISINEIDIHSEFDVIDLNMKVISVVISIKNNPHEWMFDEREYMLFNKKLHLKIWAYGDVNSRKFIVFDDPYLKPFKEYLSPYDKIVLDRCVHSFREWNYDRSQLFKILPLLD